MSDQAIQRATMLLGAGRAEDAFKEAGHVLADEPDDAHAHALQALALAQLEEYSEALESAQRASGADPEWAFTHYTTAQVLLGWDKAKPALVAAQEAVSLDPDDEDYHGMVAACCAALKRWREGLKAAERGLELAPEDDYCTNLRALCLRQLGDVDGASSALESNLANDPDNAWSHQNMGFAFVQAGRYDDAIASFRESLRLDPSDENARQGLAMALKGKVPLYRPIIAWQMFCTKISGQLGYGLVIGLMVLVNVVRRSLGPDSTTGTVIIIAYVSLVWMSWAAGALFDVLLFLRRDLRPILTGREKTASLGVVICLLLAAATLTIRFAVGLPGMEWTALAFAFAAIPMAAWAKLDNPKARGIGLLIAGAATLLGCLGLGLEVQALNMIEWDMDYTGPLDEIEATVARFTQKLDFASQLSMLALLTSVGSSWLMPLLGLVPEKTGGRGQRRRPR